MFYITPSSGHSNVEVCLLPILRRSSVKYSIDDIKTLGQCTKEFDKNHQYVLSFELDPDEYVALIYAHSDHSFVSIPALNLMLAGDHYEFQFSMQSCDNVISFVSSDSYSITISNSYVWAPSNAPRITVYYTSNLDLKLKDIAKFNKKSFSGVHGVGNHQFRITNLTPYTKYQFYVFLEATGNGASYIRPLISNRLIGMTYKTCTDPEWSEVGVGMESKISCTIGYHAYYCSKLENYEAAFTTRRDPCYCPEEEVNGVVYPQTQYNHTAPSPIGKRYCGWQGIWESVPSLNCMADGEWPETLDGDLAVKKCENDGQLVRRCIYGEWQEVENQNCQCPHQTFEEVTWGAANRNEIKTHQCGVGSMTRFCNEWGWWETPENVDCRCATDGIWTERPHNTTQYEQCGTQGVEGNSATRRCRNDGFWEEVNYTGCMCDAVTENEISWPSTPMDEAAWIQCDVGSKARICLTGGFWDSNVADYNCACEADMDWPQTLAGETWLLPCPDNPRKSQTRRCRNNGVWEDVDSIGCYGSCPAYGRFPVTLSGTTATVECEEGGGQIVMNCLRKVDANGDYYGEWDLDSWHVEGECLCASNDEFPTVPVNTEAILECDSGSRTKKCGKFTARWESPVNNNCQCTVTDAPFSVPFTPLYETVTVECGNGTRSVYCGKYGHYENIDDSNCFCAADGKYGTTPVGETVTANCVESGTESRECPSSGFWKSPDYSMCRCNSMSELTDFMLPSTTFSYNCTVGMYHIECDSQGETQIVEKTCACPAEEGFPEAPADSHYREQCGIKWKTGYCNIYGVWETEDPCKCPATDLFPSIRFGEMGEAILPQCYMGYCNPMTGVTEIDYSGCGCAPIDDWPAMAHNETIQRPCSTGGWRTAHCSMGVLSVDYEDCACLDTEGQVVAVGDYQSFPCMLGFVLKQCRGDNFWYDITDSYCGCASSDSALRVFEFMLANTTKTVECGSGSMTITCDGTGHFDMDSWVKQCKCPAENLWPETNGSDVARIQCASSTDQTERSCNEYGEWQTATGRCNCRADGEWPTSESGNHMQMCPSGSIIRRTCNDDGTWGEATGSCLDKSCPADGVFPLTPHLGSYTHTCGNGFRITRTCTAGVWSTVDWSQCGCADDDGFVSGEFIDPNIYSTFSSQPCGEGERLRECRYGVWQEVDYSNCYCAPMGPLPRTQALKEISRPCPVGAMTGSCLKTGSWEVVSDTCGCAEDSYTVEDLVFEATPHGESLRKSCLSGYMERRCDDSGNWESLNYSQCKCVAEGWTDALPTEVGHMSCEEGSVTRMCKPNGQWGAISSDACACAANDLFPRTIIEKSATHFCDNGTVTATCSFDGWINEVDNDCACMAIDGYPMTPRNSFAAIPCGEFQLGIKTRQCLRSGAWEAEEDESQCVDYCPALGDWNYTRPGTTATLPCPPGYSGGEITRYCNEQGLWEQGVSTCIPLRCPAIDGFPITSVNSVATVSCPSGQTGSLSRPCELVDNAAVWGEIENQCEDAFCVVGDNSYAHNAMLTMVCEEGQIGERQMRCDTGEWIEVSNTCQSIVCPADEAQGYPAGVYGDIYHVNCGVDYSGMVVMQCNAFQQWEHVSGSCIPVEPTLRCEPADGTTNVALSPMNDEEYTVYCTSNVRVKEVVNDELERMNVHIVFETASTTLSYPTSAVIISEYTVAFLFQGSFPPSSEGSLYINSGSFVSYTGISYPAATLVQSFATCEGTPLPPGPVLDSSITIQSVNYVERTATLKLTLPFDTSLYEEGELVFIGSNLQSVRFTSASVIVEGAILNSVIPITWRVRNGNYWSEFASFSVYRPIVLLPPSRPVVSTFSAHQVKWTWSEAELFGETFTHYAWILYADGEEVQSGTVLISEVQLDLEAGKTYSLRVAVCAESCSIFSEASEGLLVSSTIITPSSPRDPTIIPIQSTSLDVTWKEPVNAGGSAILSYHVRRSSRADMSVIDTVYETTETSLRLTDVTARVYLEIAAFNGYLSAPLKFTVDPQPLQAIWMSNNDEGVLLDNAIMLKGQFTYLSVATCVVSDPSHPSFSKTLSFSPSTQVDTILQPLAPETSYHFVCDVSEIGSEAVAHNEFTVTTAATAELVPALVVDGEPTSSLTVSVTVTTNLLGHLTCFVAPYQGQESRPTSLTAFGGNWAQSVEVTHVASPIELLFAVDVDGALLDASETYHAWCVLQREVLEYENDTSSVVSLFFPDYQPSTSTRRLLQAESFEIVSIDPSEFAVGVDPSTKIRVSFSLPATVSDGAVTLLSGDNELIRISSEQIHCLQTTCVIQVEGGLQPKQQYVLNVAKDAFVNGASPLEEEVKNHFFETGLQRCDTKYVSKGLWNTKMCECFSVENKCECECGETSVMRAL